MSKIGIIGAMDVEVEGIVNAMEKSTQTEIGGSVFYAGKIGKTDVVVVQSGIGKVNAAFVASTLYYRFGVDSMLMTGVCGGLQKVGPMDAFVPTVFIQHDVENIGEEDGYLDIVNRIELQADEKLSDELARATGAVRGVMASGEQFIGGQEQIDVILKKFPKTVAVDMESGAVAHVCARLGIPFACIKIVSDGGDGGDFFTFKVTASEKSVRAVLEVIK